MPFDIAWPSGHKETVDAATFRQRHADYRDALVVFHTTKDPAKDLEVFPDLDRTVARLVAHYRITVLYDERPGVYVRGEFDGATVHAEDLELADAVFRLLTKAEDEAVPVKDADPRIPTDPCPRCGDDAWDVYHVGNDPAWCTHCGLRVGESP